MSDRQSATRLLPRSRPLVKSLELGRLSVMFASHRFDPLGLAKWFLTRPDDELAHLGYFEDKFY